MWWDCICILDQFIHRKNTKWILEMAYQFKCKRGLAYKCMHCIYPESFLAEKNRVEAHILKRHLALDKARYYCTLCMFRCNDRKNLDRHLVSFVPHLRQKETQIASNKYLGDLAYLKESPAPHSFNTTVRDYVPLTQGESARFWATKSRGEPVSPLVSLPLPQASNPVSLPPAYYHMPTMSSTTTLASIPPSYHYLPTMTSTTPANLPQPSYQHLPIMSSTIPADHLIPQTMPHFQTATAQSHLPVPSLYPTTTATGRPQQSTIPSAPTLQMSTMPSTTHFYTAEPLEQSLNIPSPSINTTITTTADLSSYLPIDVDECHDYEAFSPEIGSPTRKVLEREAVAMSKDEEVMECILPQLLGQDPSGTCSNLDARHAISNDKKKPDVSEDSNHQIIQALANLTKSQQLILQELGHLNKSVTTLSSDISFLRGQFRQQERIINRQQRVLDRLNTVNRIPRANARTTPYNRTTAAGTQKKPKVKSVIVKDN